MLQFRADCGRFENIAKILRRIKRIDKKAKVSLNLVGLYLLKRHIGQGRRIAACNRFVQLALLSSSETNPRSRDVCASGVSCSRSTDSARSTASRAANAFK